MASFTPWILLSFTIVLCVTGQGFSGSRINPCSCTKTQIIKRGPEPKPENVQKCLIQEASRDCHSAIVVKRHKGKPLCFDPTLPWIDGFINSTSCEPLLVPLSGF